VYTSACEITTKPCGVRLSTEALAGRLRGRMGLLAEMASSSCSLPNSSSTGVLGPEEKPAPTLLAALLLDPEPPPPPAGAIKVETEEEPLSVRELGSLVSL